jgi:hypothetical protein
MLAAGGAGAHVAAVMIRRHDFRHSVLRRPAA